MFFRNYSIVLVINGYIIWGIIVMFLLFWGGIMIKIIYEKFLIEGLFMVLRNE